MSVYIEKLLATARGELGTTESPPHSNDGAGVRKYQAITHAYRAPWCASFVQWVLTRSGIGPIANDTAGAYYMGDYARRMGWQVPTALPGAVVVYHLGQGHVGIVESVNPDHTFYAIEGNENDSVTRMHRSPSLVYCFFVPPGEKKAPRKVQVPRFEIVTSSNGHAVTRVVWGKWSKVGPKLPGILKKYRQARVLRKVVTVTV